jgi:hypothetical protein
MRIQIGNKVSIILTLMAGASLVSMLATLNIDHIVNRDLYNYGLQFNANWAVPYWTMAAVVFSMGWLIITISIAYELNLLVNRLHKRPKPEAPLVNEQLVQNETPKVTAKPSEKPEEEEMKGASNEEVETTALAVKTDDELSQFQVIVEEVSDKEDVPVVREKKDEKPANQEV